MSKTYSECFKGGTKFFLRVVFFSAGGTKMALGESGGMLPRKMFENLNTVMAILVLFE